MQRRTFLKTLGSLGVAISLPVPLAEASASQVDVAWQDYSDTWTLFTVDEEGTLSLANYVWPKTRKGAYGLPDGADVTAEQINNCCPLAWHMADYYRREFLETVSAAKFRRRFPGESIRDHIDFPEYYFGDWFSALQGEQREKAIADIDAFLDDEPDWCHEIQFLGTDFGAQGAAYAHLRGYAWSEQEKMGVEIVEGDHPGSTYYAAELTVPIEEANARARELGTGMLFINESEVDDDDRPF